jgi:CRP/FNR family cyclic AMP-dependent transcriptional regulator
MVTSRVGKRVTLRHINRCEAMDLDSVMSASPHYATGETLAPSQVSFFPKKEFVLLVRSDPDFSLKVGQQLSCELHRAWDQTCLVTLAPSAKAKLATLIIDRAKRYGKCARNGTGIRIPLNATAEEVGEEIGASRETVTRLLSDLKREGLVRLSGGSLSILKLDALRELTGTS